MSDETPEKKWFHVDDPASVGRRLREARQQAGLSQRQLAFPGCTAVYICRIEKGDRVPSLQVLRELANRLEICEGWLTKGEEAARRSELMTRFLEMEDETLEFLLEVRDWLRASPENDPLGVFADMKFTGLAMLMRLNPSQVRELLEWAQAQDQEAPDDQIETSATESPSEEE